MSIESTENTGQRLLASIDALAEQAKEIVRTTSPIIEEIIVVIRSAQQAFGQGAGQNGAGTAASTQHAQSDGPSASKSAWTMLLGVGAAGCILAYLMWPRG